MMYEVTIYVVGCVYVVVVIMDYVGLVLYNVVGCVYFLFVVVVVVGMDLMGFWVDYFLVLVVFGEELFVD
jgi:hypothetical protein